MCQVFWYFHFIVQICIWFVLWRPEFESVTLLLCVTITLRDILMGRMINLVFIIHNFGNTVVCHIMLRVVERV